MSQENQNILRIIKLGGSLITKKKQLETLNEELLDYCIKYIIKPLYQKGGKTILVHGAGSFGHFQAKKYNIAFGIQNEDKKSSLIGHSLTRESVLKLNSLIMNKLLNNDIPACTISLFPFWITDKEEIVESTIKPIKELLDIGFIPVFHGDAVLDQSKGLSILSGDSIVKFLSIHLKPDYVTFLTDVDGIFDKPPSEKNAVLINSIPIDKNGNILSQKIKVDNSNCEHDVTGGMKSKLLNAISIALHGINVYIVKGGTFFSIEAAFGSRPAIGTHIYLSDENNNMIPFLNY